MIRSFIESLNKDTMGIITRMAYIAELKEWDNRPHLDRIRRYCNILVSGLGLPQPEIEVIVAASLLHDIGKIQLPEQCLNKTGQFEKSEWEIVESHTLHGAAILAGSSSPVLQTAETIALTHHERWDGSGYPRGLHEDEIPMTGRVVALADVFDALTSPRPYKEPLDVPTGLKIIQNSSGILFDPDLVKIFSDNSKEVLRINTQ